MKKLLAVQEVCGEKKWQMEIVAGQMDESGISI